MFLVCNANAFSKILIVKLILIFSFVFTTPVLAHVLAEKIKVTSPSIVGIGIHTPIQSRQPQLVGTGFVVGDGSYIVTNYHVISKELDIEVVSNYVAMAGKGQLIRAHVLELIGHDPVHDLALLKIKGTTKLPPLSLAPDELTTSGVEVYFTGFPIGAVLGLYPASHRGMIAAVAPDIIPARNADQLTIDLLKRLKTPFLIYQLDATAYPGNSGSPVFDTETNQVIGVINKVFVSAGKESALTNPTGISYAIPIKNLRALAQRYEVIL